MRNPETQEQIESTAAKLPINTNAEAVLGYSYKGERKYFAIPSFQKLKSLTYP